MPQHHTYNIKQNDSLESIAQEHNMTVEELCRYHNIYCVPLERIEGKITYQREVIIPLEKKKANTEQEPKNVNFGSNNKLSYFPYNTFYKYGVNILVENGKNKNELKYEVSVSCKTTIGGDPVFVVNRISKIYINNTEADNIADVLAYKTSQILYPIAVLVDKEGVWKQILPSSEYTERWNVVKEEIVKQFEGEMVEEYLHKIEKKLNTPELIAHLLSGDFVIRTLFLGYCSNFEKDLTQQKQIKFPIVDNAIDPEYKAVMKVNPQLDEYNLINVELEGNLDDKRTQGDFINKSPFASEESVEKNTKVLGDIKAKAFLNPNNCMPEMVHLECSIELEKTKKISINIANLSDIEVIPVRNTKFSVLEVDGHITEKVSFWNKIKTAFN